nr:hypothetical protein [Pseudomonas sp.]
MLEDLDNLAARIQQLVQLASSAQAENRALAERAETEKRALTERAKADYEALALRADAQQQALAERLERAEAENRQLRSMLASARDRVDSVLARLPDPDAEVRPEETEQLPHGTA